MGNSSSGLGYDLGESVPYKNTHWTLSAGLKKEDKDDRERVSIFRFLKSQADKLQPAQRCVQKIRTLRHPYVLTFLESADIEDSILLVTEQCTPLEQWLENVNIDDATPEVKESTVQELLWGFRCILNGLQFLHANNISHGYLGPQSIFVAKNGDWKIGAFDLACNLSSSEDFSFLKTHVKLLQRPYIAPERENFINGTTCSELTTSDASGAGKGLAVNWHADIYSVAQCMKLSFERLGLEEPAGLSKYYPRMLSAEPKRRPTASQMEKCPVFSNDNIKLLISLGELSLRAPFETLDILKQLTSQVANIPQPVCLHKILPAIKNSLMIATAEFVNRDSREGCRQSIQLTLALLQELGAKHKMDEDSFVAQVLPSVLQLWQMTDRIIRTALLHSLKQLVPYTPAGAINKSVFDPMLAGFADSNAKMREETLKSLVHVVEKLDEKHLQDKLVRCIMNLQNDGEASIRTNATIFLGRIATKLREPVRVRVLCPAFAKAMRDNFVHSRVAGLKAAIACIQLLEHTQLTSKVMPQVCTLLLDRSAEVRELSIAFLEASLKIIREQHDAMTEAEKTAAAAAVESHVGKTAAARHSSSDESAGKTGSSWASWAVDGLSKTLEKATVGDKDKGGDKDKNSSFRAGDGSSASTAVSSGIMNSSSHGSMDSGDASPRGHVVSVPAATSRSTTSTTSAAANKLGLPVRPPKAEAPTVTKLKTTKDDAGWGDEWGDFDIEVEDEDKGEKSKSHESKSSFTMDDYAEFLDDLDLDDIDDEGGLSKSDKDKGKNNDKDKKDNNRGSKEKEKEKGSGIVGTLGKEKSKPVPKSSGWGDDDFDVDMDGDNDNSPPPPPVKKAPATAAAAASSTSATSKAVKGMTLEKPAAAAKPAKAAKPVVAVKKLERSSTDNWDDF